MAYALDRSKDAIFVERLHAKTMARGLAWTRTEHDGRYQTRLGEFVVEIGEGAASVEDPEILICAADGRAIEVLRSEALSENAEAGPAGRYVFQETWEAARRMALNVDGVIDGLIHALV